jgi:hypothetical protein
MITESIAKNIVELVNAQTGLKLVFDHVLDTSSQNEICCTVGGNDHKLRYIVGNHCSWLEEYGKYFVQSVLKKSRKNKAMSWLCNGQAGTNSIELFFFGEELIYLLTNEDKLSWLEARSASQISKSK